MDFTKQLQWRYATKAFDASKPLSEKDWQTLKDSLRLAPSSYGLQPWKFIVVEDAKTRAALREKAFGQSQVTDAAKFIVIASKKNLAPSDVEAFAAEIAKARGVEVSAIDRYKQLMLQAVNGRTAEERAHWAALQSYIPLGFVMATAAYLNIDTCPMEGFDSGAFDDILGLDALGLTAAVCVAIGYRSATDKSANDPKVRWSEQDVFLTK